MDPYGLRFDYLVMWIVTGSHSSNGCFVLSLKTVSFHLFSVFFFPYTTLFGAYALNKIETLKQWNPHLTLWALCLSLTLSITSLVSASLPRRPRSLAQIATHSLNHSLPLSHSHLCLSPSSPSQLTLYLIVVAAHSLPHCRHSYSIASLPRLQGTLSILILLSFMSI